MTLDDFHEVWAIDFEYRCPPGHRPEPHCLVAIEYHSGRRLEVTDFDLQPPFDISPTSLIVAHQAAAEMSCFLALGWPQPAHILDTFIEAKRIGNRAITGGCPRAGLLEVLTVFGLPTLAAEEKQEWRELAIRGKPFTREELAGLVAYCARDVEALVALLPRMLPNIPDIPQACLRGRYQWAVASMERAGIPIDAPMLDHLRDCLPAIRSQLIAAVDGAYGVFVDGSFNEARFEAYLAANDIPWPRHHQTGRLMLDDKTFRSRSEAHPQLSALRQLRGHLSETRLFKDIPVGPDGRSRTYLAPFSSRTGRNQPSNSRFVFGPSKWARSLIKPAAGRAVAYIDYGQQEIAIAAALSGDAALTDAYRSGDPYLTFAKQAGAVPSDATKATHKAERELYKRAMLAVNYGMSEFGLAGQLNISQAEARELLAHHRRCYPDFWRWHQAAIDTATFTGRLETVFGWQVRVVPGVTPNPRSLGNFPCQAHGAEMLRLACCLMVEAGITVCCPVHDAVLIEADIEEINDHIAQARSLMASASRTVLAGFEVETDVEVVAYPHRYRDKDGGEFWDVLTRISGQPPQIQPDTCEASSRHQYHPSRHQYHPRYSL